MKSIVLFCLLSRFCCVADDTKIIAVSDWSEPVGFHDHSVRGRLLISNGSEPAAGGSKTNQTMMFVELQQVTGAQAPSVKIYFDVMNLSCNLTDSNGKPSLKPKFISWGGRAAFSPCWIVLPYNSTARLFVNSGSKSPLTICQGGEPWVFWSIPSNDTNVYYLSGTLTVSIPTTSKLTVTPPGNMSYHQYADWQGTLFFPKVKILASQP